MEKVLEYTSAEEAQTKISDIKDQLVVLVVINQWDLFALAAGEALNSLKYSPSLKKKCEMLFIDYDENFEFCIKHNVVAVPSILLFYNGNLLRVKRSGWEEDKKYVGLVKKDLYEALIIKAIDDGSRFVPIICD